MKFGSYKTELVETICSLDRRYKSNRLYAISIESLKEVLKRTKDGELVEFYIENGHKINLVDRSNRTVTTNVIPYKYTR